VLLYFIGSYRFLGGGYDQIMHRIIYPEGDWLMNKSELLRLTGKAKRAGKIFTPSSVMKLHQSNLQGIRCFNRRGVKQIVL